jgi:peptide-methionine (S)-S-oxide reductase
MSRFLNPKFLVVPGLVAAALLLAFNGTGAAPRIGEPAVDDSLAATSSQQTVVLAGGCFWGMQLLFEHVKGVVNVTAGYSGGSAKTAQYEVVSDGDTGHAESVKITYDPSQITFGRLLQVFFEVGHDPTTLNRQGPDEGTQYRSVIFYTTDDQQRIARAYIDQLDQMKVFPHKIVTDVTPLTGFYPAESYHQDYAVNNPESMYIMVNDLPKLDHLKKQLPDLYVKKASN